MAGIIWLASFPKSGNTWMRIFLVNLFKGEQAPADINSLPNFTYGDMRGEYYRAILGKPNAEMTDEDLDSARPKVHRMISQRSPDPIFVKTHSALTVLGGVPTITPEVTLAAIHIVRNPLDVTISYSHHYGLSISDTVDALASHANVILGNEKMVPQLLGSWSDHARSWTTANGLQLLTLRYEDMLSKPLKEFGKVRDFLQLPKDIKRLKRAVKNSAFDTVQKLEAKWGFIEQSKNNDQFFRKGQSGEWRDVLTDEQVAKTVEAHREMMEHFGYLDASGKPI